MAAAGEHRHLTQAQWNVGALLLLQKAGGSEGKGVCERVRVVRQVLVAGYRSRRRFQSLSLYSCRWEWWELSGRALGLSSSSFSKSAKWQRRERRHQSSCSARTRLACVCSCLSCSSCRWLAGCAPWPRCSRGPRTVVLNCFCLFSTIRAVVWGPTRCLGGVFLGASSHH